MLVKFKIGLLFILSVFSLPAFAMGQRHTYNEFAQTFVKDWITPSSSEISQLASELTYQSGSDMEKLLAIHDWVASNIAFDTVNYFNKTYENIKYDDVTVLHSKVAICIGYSTLMSSLLLAASIPSKIVIGDAIQVFTGDHSAKPPASHTCGHAWNQVLIDGRWVNVDATWDAGTVNLVTQQFTQKLSHTYLDMDPAKFDQTHVECGESNQTL